MSSTENKVSIEAQLYLMKTGRVTGEFGEYSAHMEIVLFPLEKRSPFDIGYG